METHGAPGAALAQRATGLMPKAIAAPTLQRVGIDRMAAFHTAIDAVRRGGTISLSGVYGRQSDPLPMMTVFDKQITLCMGQANVHRWVDDILPLLIDGDPLRVEQFATHHVPLDDAPAPTRTSSANATERSKSSSDPDQINPSGPSRSRPARAAPRGPAPTSDVPTGPARSTGATRRSGIGRSSGFVRATTAAKGCGGWLNLRTRPVRADSLPQAGRPKGLADDQGEEVRRPEHCGDKTKGEQVAKHGHEAEVGRGMPVDRDSGP